MTASRTKLDCAAAGICDRLVVSVECERIVGRLIASLSGALLLTSVLSTGIGIGRALASGALTGDDAVVAFLNGEAVPVGAFREYVGRARGAPYRPRTEAEAARLLRGLLRERFIGQLQAAHSKSESGFTRSDVDVDVLIVPANEGDPATSLSGSGEAGGDLGRWLAAQRVAVQRRRRLDHLLEQQQLRVDQDVLRGEVLSAMGSAGPPLPPGMGR